MNLSDAFRIFLYRTLLSQASGCSGRGKLLISFVFLKIRWESIVRMEKAQCVWRKHNAEKESTVRKGRSRMSRRRRKKKKGTGTILFLSVVILAGGITLFGLTNETFAGKLKSVTTDKVKDKAQEEILEQALEQILESTGDPEAAEKAKEIMDSIDEEDKQKAKEMIGKYVNKDTISEMTDLIEEGINKETVTEVTEYLKESISEEDKQKLEELYQKYGGGF